MIEARIRIGEVIATLEDDVWECSDADLQVSLNDESHRPEISGADPQPHRTIAEAAVARLGGEVLYVWEEPMDEDAVY